MPKMLLRRFNWPENSYPLDDPLFEKNSDHFSTDNLEYKLLSIEVGLRC